MDSEIFKKYVPPFGNHGLLVHDAAGATVGSGVGFDEAERMAAALNLYWANHAPKEKSQAEIAYAAAFHHSNPHMVGGKSK